MRQYLDTQYVAAPKAFWRLFQFDTHGQSPTVVRLQVHLPGQHLVTYNPNESPEVVAARAVGEQTMLTAFFEANREESGITDFARQYTYQEFPQHFVWKEQQKWWALRQQGFALGWMYFVSPTAGDCFYLRLLLTVVKGPTLFEDLRSYNSETLSTFCEACRRGLLEDDNICLEEAAEMQTGESTSFRLACHLHLTVVC